MLQRQEWRWRGVAVALWVAAVITAGNRGANGEDGGPGLMGRLTVAIQPADAAQPPEAEPPAEPPRVQPAPVPPPTTVARYRPSRFRLASVPNMFGDTLPPVGQLFVSQPQTPNLQLQSSLPLAGAARRIKIAENNHALPKDRVFFTYNHFENALDVNYGFLSPPPPVTSEPVDRYVVGIEKTFFDELCSVDVRMPFVSRFHQSTTDFGLSGGEIGNLHVNVKGLLYTTDCWAVGGGLGIDIPTGSDAKGTVVNSFAPTSTTSFRVNNEAVYLMPFIGLVGIARDCWFYQGFLEVGVPLNGNTVVVDTQTGTFNEQTILNLDFSFGRWLVRRPADCVLTGMAAVAEFHYTTTLNDSDAVTLLAGNTDRYGFASFDNRLDIAHATVAVHTEFAGNKTLRVGGVFPLRDARIRLFDAEVVVQLNCYF